jgi:Cys-rich protein (TIGR01571 family)
LSGWWGTWCCWILNARTIATFELNKSLTEIFIFWCFFLGIIFLFYFPSTIGFILILCGIFYLTYRRASYRTMIREKLSITGTFSDDLVKHLCCPCCSICQEAREANETSLLILDYCSGEQIVMQEIAHDIATGRINSTLQSPPTSTDDEGGTFWNHLINISLTSKIILSICSLIICLSFFILFLLEKEQNLIILLLTFSQPILILYFVYWKSRRQYATLDMVIKLFAIGFWLTTFQSIIFEEILQTILIIVLGPFIATSLTTLDDDYGGTDMSGDVTIPSSSSSSSSSSVMMNGSSLLSSSKIKKIIQIFQLVTAAVTTTSSSADGVEEYQYEQGIGHEALSSSQETETGDNTDETIRQKMKHHLWLVILVVFTMAFVIAAGVEETMKHFSVRCCRFPAPLNDPHTILVYLMASGYRQL